MSPGWQAGVAAAAGVVAAVALLAGTAPYTAVGSADPGMLVAVGTPVLRLVADLAAVVCVGALGFAVCCTHPRSTGLVTPQAYRELAVAARGALVWSASAALLVPFAAADTTGLPLGTVLVPEHLAVSIGATEPPKAWLVAALMALVVGAGCRAALRWHTAAALLGLAVLALLPPVVTAHGSADTGHDLALAAMVIHVPAAALWVGALAALWRQIRGPAALAAGQAELVARYSRVATGCWLVLVGSGLVLVLVLVPPGMLLTTSYGLLVLLKVTVVAALGVAGTALRGRARRKLEREPGRGGGWRTLARLGAAELVALLGVLGMSVGLTRLAVPDALSRAVSTTQTVLGYDLAGPPNALRLATDWRVDVLFGPLAVLLAACYLVGVHRVRQSGARWPVGRSAAWLAGCAVLLVTTSSGLGRYAAAMFSVHLAAHMLVSMVVPALLALGGPVTLMRTAMAPATQQRLPGLRDWADALGNGRATRVLTHPAVSLVLFAGSPFALYFTPLFDLAVRFHWAHLAIDGWFLVVGYLFLWPVLGTDPAPRHLPTLARVGLLVTAMPADIGFAVAVMTSGRVIGNGVAASNMYQALALPWVPDLLADQRLAGVLALAIGEIALFGMLIVLVVRWNVIDHETETDARTVLSSAVRGSGGR